MRRHRQHPRLRPTTAAHALGIVGGLALGAIIYTGFYAGRVEPIADPTLAYTAVRADNGLQVWRIGATKALAPDASIRLVYSTVGTCAEDGQIAALRELEVRPVAKLIDGNLLKPATLTLASADVSLEHLCGSPSAARELYWSTDSVAVKMNLERFGRTPEYYAAQR